MEDCGPLLAPTKRAFHFPSQPGPSGTRRPIPSRFLWYEGRGGSPPPVSLPTLDFPGLGGALLCLQDCALASVRPSTPPCRCVESFS